MLHQHTPALTQILSAAILIINICFILSYYNLIQRFESESELCDSVLTSSSKELVLNVLKTTLIVNHMDALIRSFDMFLDNFQVHDLQRLHSLITLTEGHLQPILEAFQVSFRARILIYFYSV